MDFIFCLSVFTNQRCEWLAGEGVRHYFVIPSYLRDGAGQSHHEVKESNNETYKDEEKANLI